MVKKRKLCGSGKSRVKSPTSGDELLSARDRFKGALQDLLPKSEDESESTDEDLEREYSSRNKRLAARKKFEKGSGDSDQEVGGSSRQPFIMKLFDRGVDLSQFDEDTPLYPICRAWIANQPHHGPKYLPLKSSPEKEDPDETEELDSSLELARDVLRLPPPSPLPDENEKLSVPEPIQNEDTKYPLIPALQETPGDFNDCPSRDELLEDNLSHWCRVRKSWLEASAKNEARYSKSIKILTAMHNKTGPFAHK